ncbi:hypothetical protein HDA40_004863 [Hamadaea flava]|uniref:Uncharacterized protein n=1 Tax=Hamadaea flava TaxID=1742688 RepID=A0ABV8LFD3_9ACTN|nr:hypothetical protein [Hamadaea flava]MCP2326356.1 hypothetical protein [Hamadaea flava]
MAGRLHVGWRLTGRGWAVCILADDLADIEVPVSYLTEAPEDFLTAVTRLLLGQPQAEVLFNAEPSIYRLTLRRTDRLDAATLRLALTGAGDIFWASEQPLDVLARAVVRAFDAIEVDPGEDGYLARWGRPFPRAELAALRSTWRDQVKASGRTRS